VLGLVLFIMGGAVGLYVWDNAQHEALTRAHFNQVAAATAQQLTGWRAERLSDARVLAEGPMAAIYATWQSTQQPVDLMRLRQSLNAIAVTGGYAGAVLQRPSDQSELAVAPGGDPHRLIDAVATRPVSAAAISLSPAARTRDGALYATLDVHLLHQERLVGVVRLIIGPNTWPVPAAVAQMTLAVAQQAPPLAIVGSLTEVRPRVHGRAEITSAGWTITAALEHPLSRRYRALWVGSAVLLLVLGLYAYLGLKREVVPERDDDEAWAILNALPEGVALADLAGRYIFANPAMCSLTGYSFDELTALTVPDLAQPKGEMRTSAGGRLETMQRGDGSSFKAEVSTVPVEWGGTTHVLRVVRDVSQREHAEAAWHESEALLLDAERIAGMGHWTLDVSTGLATWSPELLAMVGLPPGPVTVEAFEALVHADDWADVYAVVNGLALTGGRGELEFRIRRPTDGAERWIYWKADRLEASPGQPPRIRGIAQDITKRRAREDRLKQSAQVFESTQDAVVIMNANLEIEAVNRAFTVITGYVEKDLWQQPAHTLLATPWDAGAEIRRVGFWHGEVELRRRSGEVFPAVLRLSRITDNNHTVTNYIGVFSDITELKASQAKLEFLAHHDLLTGLPNRHSFGLAVDAAVQRAAESGRPGALLFLDLDRFKHINDSLGHPVGDWVLSQVAQRLLTLNAAPCRFGGDEFTLLLEDVSEAQVVAAAAQIIKTIEAPLISDEHDLALGVTIGIARFPKDGTDVDTLLSNADAAMYEAKAIAPGGYGFYSSALTERARERALLLAHLRRAVANNALYPVFQPQFSLHGGAEMTGLEALVRWRDTDGKMISPGRFIPLAEECGLILPIGAWMLRRVCEQARGWLDAGLDFGRVGVNVAAAQVQREDFADLVIQILDETGLPPDRLELELTETAVMNEAERAADHFKVLRSLGVSLAVDDFGTGHSSLFNLLKLPFDKLKIDQKFVFQLPHDPSSVAIVKACIALGHSLNFQVIAEGVETEAQAQFLTELGCDLMQGYLRGRPELPETVARYFTPRAA
jgi:diguanylate cyclase (GGDEF)-like protein/PAS domain S-box-containing protein